MCLFVWSILKSLSPWNEGLRCVCVWGGHQNGWSHPWWLDKTVTRQDKTSQNTEIHFSKPDFLVALSSVCLGFFDCTESKQTWEFPDCVYEASDPSGIIKEFHFNGFTNKNYDMYDKVGQVPKPQKYRNEVWPSVSSSWF